MPILLRDVLTENGIAFGAWGSAVIQDNGKPLSPSASSQLLNLGLFPRSTPMESIKAQTVKFLGDWGVGAGELDDIWLLVKKVKSIKTRGSMATRNSIDALYDRELPESEMLSQKARRHFGLMADPFRNDVTCASDVYLSSEHRYVYDAMRYAVKNGGFVAIVGDPGAGKTVLVDRLQVDIANEPIRLIRPRAIDKTRLTAGSICDAIIFDISLEQPKRTLEAKARQVEKLLKAGSESGMSYCLLIDEAHGLTNATWRYLKRFREIRDGLRVLLGVVVVGQSEMHQVLDAGRNPEIKEVIYRIEVATLRPLDGDIKPYLKTKFSRISKRLEEVFDEDAFDAIGLALMRVNQSSKQAVSVSYPLMVNNAVTAAMNIAAMAGIPRINSEVMKEI